MKQNDGQEEPEDRPPPDLERLVTSPLPPDRAEAGRWLAGRAGQPRTDALLHQLLLRDETTLVPYEVAEALLERRDVAGGRVLARAIAEADHRDLDYHWILDAVGNVWMQTFEDLRLAQSLWSALIDDVDPTVATGARELLDFTTTGERR